MKRPSPPEGTFNQDRHDPPGQKEMEILRAGFVHDVGRSLAMPIAGIIVWTVVGGMALILEPLPATFVLLWSTGLLFPLALGIARVLGENIISGRNPLARLMGMSVLMVNLLWAVHISLLIRDFELLSLTLGIGLGLHWIVFSWIIHHRVGIVHAILRTILVTGLWWAFPGHPVAAVAAGVVIAYGYAIVELVIRPLPSLRG